MPAKDLASFFAYMNYSKNNTPFDYRSTDQSPSSEFMFEIQAQCKKIMVYFMPKLKFLRMLKLTYFSRNAH